MNARWKKILAAVVAVLVGAALLVAGRASVDTDSVRDAADRNARSAGYLEGLAAGQAQGLREGRALQEGIALPAGTQDPVRKSFTAGYLAGSNDAFNQYDGGWSLDAPYVVTLSTGSAGVTYRIGSRVLVEPGVNYYLCPDGHGMCQEPRP